MSILIDQKYARLLPLEKPSLKNHGRYFLNFRCPLCGDSSKSASKKRGWFQYNSSRTGLNMTCYNCGAFMPFWAFLKYHYPMYYSEYIKEVFVEEKSFGRKPTLTAPSLPLCSEYDKLNLSKLKDLPEDHPAVKYLLNRKYKTKHFGDFYYCDNFNEWAHEQQPENFHKIEEDDPRILIPLYTRHKKIFAVCARTICGNSPKYVTMKFDEEHPKIFGLDTVDFSKTVLVLEGPLDSKLLPNAIAMVGATSGLSRLTEFFKKDQLIIIADNEKRNKFTVNYMRKALKLGFKVVIWPPNFPYKDINEAVVEGVSLKFILEMIKNGICEGYSGLVKLNFWKRC